MANENLNPYTYWGTNGKDRSSRRTSHPLVPKVSGISKGTGVYIIPLSSSYGDDITAVGRNCASLSDSFTLLEEPFYGSLEEFDGDTLTLRTDFCYKLAVSIAELKDVIVSSRDK